MGSGTRPTQKQYKKKVSRDVGSVANGDILLRDVLAKHLL